MHKAMKLNINIQKGYTLIEIMVAVAIFFGVLVAPTGFLIVSLKSQMRTLASQELLDQTSYVLEYVSRALRMAKKDKNASCIDLNSNYRKTDSRILAGVTYSGPGIKFESYHDTPVCQEIFLDESDGRLKESKNGAAPLPLTSDDLEVLSFNVSGEESWDQYDNSQPRVTFSLEVKGGKNLKPEIQPKMRIQTTVSQRNLDVTY